MSSFETPGDPVSLAKFRAEDTTWGFEMMPEDHQMLAELEHGADVLGFLNQRYFVEAHRGMIFPRELESDTNVTYVDFMDGITFEGRFLSYSRVHVGRIIGVGAVRAVCLTFDTVTLLPFFDEVEEDKLLHIPVLSVNSAEQAA